MPHIRDRFLIKKALKKLSFTPVLLIQGVRQSGKSLFVRKILSSKIDHFNYVTFDRASDREFAQRNPDSFLARFDSDQCLSIDEAQKVPDIFDAVKLQVDETRRPGRYILLGSTEFSREMKIRESLTGRATRLRMLPFSIGEALQLKHAPTPFLNKASISRRDFLRHLDRGGFPAIFAVRSSVEQGKLIEDWLNTSIHRDLHEFRGFKLDSDLALSVLERCATVAEPTAGEIAKTLKKDLRRIQTHLNILSQLFILHKIDPIPGSTGKSRYYLCDSGLAQYLNASFDRQLETQLILERMVAASISDENIKLFFYRSQKGADIKIIEEHAKNSFAIHLHPEEKFDERTFERLRAFKKVYLTLNSKKKLNSILLCGIQEKFESNEIHVLPWENMRA